MEHKIIAASGREFEAHAAGLIALIIDPQERFLLLSHPRCPGKWEPVNGAYDANETVLDGLLREIREEAGAQIRVRPLTAVHSYSFRYDDQVPQMISLIFLFEYAGGEVIAADDMQGSEVRWLTIDEITSGAYEVIIPSQQLWVYERALKLYRLLKDEPAVILQPDPQTTRNKYELPIS